MEPSVDAIAGQLADLYRGAIDPVADRFAWRARPGTGELRGGPTVLLLGNHSSGKSSFINHLLAADVQTTGLAPTDDGFTIISHGKREEVRDGAALVGNPDLPYGPLRSFGDGLVSHLRLKRRPHPLLQQLTLIDSPGMIDTLGDDGGRGYDFPGVVRWLAERADVVLFFFDPDKPGTTGETLQVFEQSLRGLDHKLLIVMNKMDRFKGLQDFARAYGALCWNLGKIIPRKDLPLIYTTYTPVEGAPPPALPKDDFDRARRQLIDEVRRAPMRRVDNLLTQTADFAERLRMHARVLDAAARDLRRFRRRTWLWGGLATLALVAMTAVAGISDGPAWLPIALGVASGCTLWGALWLGRALVDRERRHLLQGLDGLFERLYARPLLVRDRADDLRARWDAVRERTLRTGATLELADTPRLKQGELKALSAAIDVEIPKLRAALHAADAPATPPPD
ncbi:MAG: dynamin family protein [Myxococcales bacterium]|nr:dynamin family protein [Myxococcales bacterium]MCB9535206.1 dynamin family protein [Myxococcales bacterium]